MRGKERLFIFGILALVLTGLPGMAYSQPALDGFDPNPNSTVSCIAVQPDGKILVGGAFGSIAGATRHRMARLNPDGSIDPDFDPNILSEVSTIAVQPDGKILVGGPFYRVGGVTRWRIARLNPNGSLDPAFDPNGTDNSGWVHAIALQPDGKILIGGEFLTVGGVERKYLARLNPDGSLDTAFNFNLPTGGFVYSLALQEDGKILVGSTFSQYGGDTFNGLIRLNPEGTLDTGFETPASTPVYSLAVQADGMILAGATFNYPSQPVLRWFLARFQSGGMFDWGFDPHPAGIVRSIVLQTDGKILLGGEFRGFGDGEERLYFARLNPDGSLDAAFNPGANYNIYAMAMQADGKILLGGWFTTIGGGNRNYLARLTNTDPALQELEISPNGKTVTWLRGQTSPEVGRVTFEQSADGNSWASLGNGIRIAGGWRLTGLSLPFNEDRYLRARGYASGSLFESVTMFHLKPLPKVDFNGDGQEDLVWRNPTTGRTTIWYMDGATWNGGYADILPELAGPDWELVGIADFNNDSNPDLLWRNTVNGRTTIWYMTGSTWNGGYADVEPTLSDMDWSIVGVADFNGDGNPDLLWRHRTSGRTTIWYMTGPVWNGGYADVEPTLSDPNWSIVGVADFNGDGSPDLLWRNKADGRATIWYMTGPVWNGGYAEVLPTLSDPNWAIVAVRDFNGDGSPDLLWRNTSSNPEDPNSYRTTVWYMDGPVWNGNWGDLLPTVSDPNWVIIGR